MKFETPKEDVWRVGFRPQPWNWTGWRWAGTEGRFNGRWDSLTGRLYRTVYAGDTLLACFVELLAPLRPDPLLVDEFDQIQEDEEDAKQWPTEEPGFIDLDEWASRRCVGVASLSGQFVDVTASGSIADLYPDFAVLAKTIHGLKDFDAAALKSPEHRALTQSVSEYLWKKANSDGTDYCDGICFRSRHGDDYQLWAVFERGNGDEAFSHHLTNIRITDLDWHNADLIVALDLLKIQIKPSP